MIVDQKNRVRTFFFFLFLQRFFLFLVFTGKFIRENFEMLSEGTKKNKIENFKEYFEMQYFIVRLLISK